MGPKHALIMNKRGFYCLKRRQCIENAPLLLLTVIIHSGAGAHTDNHDCCFYSQR